MKSKFALVGLLVLGACTSLTPTQELITACEAGERARIQVANAMDAGQITSPDKIKRILAVSDSIHAVCTNREFIRNPNISNAAVLVAGQAAILTDALLEVN